MTTVNLIKLQGGSIINKFGEIQASKLNNLIISLYSDVRQYFYFIQIGQIKLLRFLIFQTARYVLEAYDDDRCIFGRNVVEDIIEDGVIDISYVQMDLILLISEDIVPDFLSDFF